MVGEISARQIAVSALKAQRVRMNVIAQNLANIDSVTTPEGGPFRRQLAVLQAESPHPGSPSALRGVRVARLEKDMSPFRTVYNPGHPEADESGYVSYPNINTAVEMVDLISAQRAYEAGVAVIASDRRMVQKALEIIQD